MDLCFPQCSFLCTRHSSLPCCIYCIPFVFSLLLPLFIIASILLGHSSFYTYFVIWACLWLIGLCHYVCVSLCVCLCFLNRHVFLCVGYLSVGVSNVQRGCWCFYNYVYLCVVAQISWGGGLFIWLLSLSICDFHCAILRVKELGLHFIRPIWAFAFFGVSTGVHLCALSFCIWTFLQTCAPHKLHPLNQDLD